jgi:hypothetical protein
VKIVAKSVVFYLSQVFCRLSLRLRIYYFDNRTLLTLKVIFRIVLQQDFSIGLHFFLQITHMRSELIAVQKVDLASFDHY